MLPQSVSKLVVPVVGRAALNFRDCKCSGLASLLKLINYLHLVHSEIPRCVVLLVLYFT